MAEKINIGAKEPLYKAAEKINNAMDEVNIAVQKSDEASVKSINAETTANSVQEQFNQVVIEGDSSVEAAQARVDSEGNAYTTLKERLDSENQSVAAQLAHNENIVGINVNNPPAPLVAAKGDGVTDDAPALKNIHQFANENNLMVNYEPNKTYYLSNASEIEIKTTVDFHNAELLIDDSYFMTKSLYTVKEDAEEILADNSIISNVLLEGLNRNTKRLTSLSGYGKSLIVIVNANKQQYKRFGSTETHNQTDFFVVDNDGYLLHDVTYDFDDITSITIQPISNKTITLKNLNPINKGNAEGTTRMKRGFTVSRSNVIFENFNHEVENNEANNNPSEGIIFVNKAYNVLIKNGKLTPRVHNGTDGTYEIRTDVALDLKLENVEGFSLSSGVWGVIGGNRMKNASFKDCKLNRIDSHVGSHHITIENCKIGNAGLTLAGFGDLIIKNSQIYANDLITLRADYGAFWNGDIYIENVDHFPQSSYNFINASVQLHHDFGYPIMLGDKRIEVKNYTVHNENISDTLYLLTVWYNNATNRIQDYTLAKDWKLENIKVTNKNYGFVLIGNNEWHEARVKDNFTFANHETVSPFELHQTIIPNMKIHLVNVDFADLGNTNDSNIFRYSTAFGAKFSDNFESIRKRPLPELVIEDSELHASVRAYPVILQLKNSIIRSLYNANNGGAKSKVTVENCEVKPTVASETDNRFSVNGVSASFINTKFYVPTIGGTPTNAAFKSVYSGLLPFGNNEEVIYQYGNFNGCTLENRITLEELKTGFSTRYNYVFGTHGYNDYFTRKTGGSAGRPPSKYLQVLDTYYDGTLSKLIIWDGSKWIDQSGAAV